MEKRAPMMGPSRKPIENAILKWGVTP